MRRDKGSATARSIAAFAGAAIGVAGVVFVIRNLVLEWDEVTTSLSHVRVGWVVAAVSAGMAAMWLIGHNWLVILNRRSAVRDHTRGFVWYFVGQLGKYVPGGIWPVVGRSELAVRDGVERSDAYRATVLSMFATYGAAVAVAGIAGVVSGAFSRWLAAVVVAAAVLGPVVLGGSLARRIIPSRLQLPTSRRLLIEIARHLGVWVLLSLSTSAVVVGLGEQVSLIDVLAITAAAWVIGFVVVGVPGGIGVRESVFIALFDDHMPLATATAVALTARVVSIVVDLAGAGIAVLLGRVGRSAIDADRAVT